MATVINTPSGNIGRVLTLALLDAGEKVTVISRNPDKIQDLIARGARLVEGATDDAATLERAFEGAEQIFWLTPPRFAPDILSWGEVTARTAAEIAAKHGVKRAVLLSSVGAQHPQGLGPISVVGRVETIFEQALANVTSLRPAFFMENFLRDLGTIKAMGMMFSTVPMDKRMPIVATKDIAMVAARELRDRSWSGHRKVGVHGPADVLFTEVAEAISAAIGKPATYVCVPPEQAEKAMLDQGIPPFIAGAYREMLGGFADGRTDAAEPRSEATTTPTTIAEFAREVLAPAYQAG